MLDAAVSYFGTHGLRFAALEEVARSSDLDVGEVRRRYSTSRSLAVGIFERVLDMLEEQIAGASDAGATLTERLQQRFELELRLLEPCKALVQSWLIDSANPLSPSALLQGPLAFRYLAQIQHELEVARQRGETSGWVLPAVAAGIFICLRGRLVLSWLGDDSPAAERTVALARAEIAAFARLLAPWPRLEDSQASSGPSMSTHPPRALSAAIDVPATLASATVEVTAEMAIAAPPVPTKAAIAQVPAVLGTLAQTTPGAELELGSVPETLPEPPSSPLEGSVVAPGADKAAPRSKRGPRTKRTRR